MPETADVTPDHIALVSAASPFARKVRVTILECGLSGRVAEQGVSSTALAPDPALTAVNPLGKIPALVRPHGPMICDSRNVTRYLAMLSHTPLYPEDRLWEVLTLEALADGLMEATVLMTYERRLRPEAIVFEDWIEGQWLKAERTLAVIEADWAEALTRPLDAGQIALGCALGYVDFRHGARDWRSKAPGLAAWEARFAARPAMQATRPD